MRNNTAIINSITPEINKPNGQFQYNILWPAFDKTQ